MSTLTKLKEIADFKEFAVMLGYRPSRLSYILYVLPQKDKYIEFCIPKKNGGQRTITAPVKSLKHIQKKLADILQKCYEEVVMSFEGVSFSSHGYRKKKGVITNACIHKNKRYVYNIDIRDFFSSISCFRIRGYLVKSKYFNLHPNIAKIISDIACYNGFLPQGSPSSPVLSNILSHLIDVRMINLAVRYQCIYTRYVDDITFSTNRLVFPKQIAVVDSDDASYYGPGKELRKEFRRLNFRLNDEKSRLQKNDRRQCVTGLIVNKKVNIKREYYKRVRAMCDSLFKKDEFILYGTTGHGGVCQLEGMLSYIYHIKREVGKKKEYRTVGYRGRVGTNLQCMPRYDNLVGLCGVADLYEKLLFYKYFYMSDRPLLFCEGPTDAIHIKCALRRLCDKYEALVLEKEDGYEYKIGFLNHPKRFVELAAGSTGASAFIRVIEKYSDYMKLFVGGKKKNPVIILVDNDKASGEIRKRVRKKLGINNGGVVPVFSKYVDDLYILFVGEKDGDSIEDLYDSGLREKKIGDRVFTKKNDGYDREKEYGKMEFAINIIRENEKDIDFKPFQKLFDPISELLELRGDC